VLLSADIVGIRSLCPGIVLYRYNAARYDESEIEGKVVSEKQFQVNDLDMSDRCKKRGSKNYGLIMMLGILAGHVNDILCRGLERCCGRSLDERTDVALCFVNEGLRVSSWVLELGEG